MTRALHTWLATRTADQLAEIIGNRADERLSGAPPRDLVGLTRILSHHASLGLVLHLAQRPAIEVLEMLAALPPGPTVSQLAVTLGRPAGDPALDDVLSWLESRALAWRVGDQVELLAQLRDEFPHPLRLGPPIAALLESWTAEELRGLAATLRCTDRRLKREVFKDLLSWYSDSEAIRRTVETAPDPVRQQLQDLAWRGPVLPQPSSGYGNRFRGGWGGYSGRAEPPEPLRWATDRGLLVDFAWQGLVMPGEVGRALRGADWRPTLTLQPPRPELVAVDGEAVERECAAAVATALDQAAGVLAACAAGTVPTLKTGGIGVREVRRLARAAGCAEDAARFWLEVAFEAELLAITDTGLLATEAYDDWCARTPAARLATLLSAWWWLPATPALAGRGGTLQHESDGMIDALLRHELLRIAGDAQVAVADPRGLTAVLDWQVPRLLATRPQPDALVAALWAEASQVGCVAHGALTALGRALIAGEHLLETAEGILGPTVTTAVFQADLTVVVAGHSDPLVAALLDEAADRESRGAAVVWRFTSASVRRALDAGRSAKDLTDALTAIAADGLPQPLAYLIGDVGRQHGRVRVRQVGAVLHAEDPALIKELAAARPLARLGLVALAPTVLTATQPVPEVLAALRAAGYAPAIEDATGALVVDRPVAHRAATAPAQAPTPARADAPEPMDPAGLAKALLAAPVGDLGVDYSPTRPRADSDGLQDVIENLTDDQYHSLLHHLFEQAGSALPDEEVCLLVTALQRDTVVKIDYVDQEGDPTTLVIEPTGLDRHLLQAWCHLSDAERMFAIDQISAVHPA